MRTALTTATAVLAASVALAPAASAAPAVALPDATQASSQASSQLNVPVPGQVLPGDSVEKRLQAATDRHLSDLGHTRNGEAELIANVWAAEAVAGRVTFAADAGRGTIATDRGTGQVYRMTPEQAEERIAWLDREANPAADTYGFGTAVVRQGGTVYLVEFFLGA